MHTFIAPITSRAITTDHNRAIITGRNLATTGLAGADTEVGKSSVDGRRHPIALNSWVSNSAFTEHSGVIHDAIEPAEMFHGKIHQRVGFGRTCSVCAVKRYVFSEFLFECLPFFF
jgi:hypothetical protein